MDEATWLTCDDPQQMLGFLRGKVSDRKLRLFAVAFGRHAFPQLPDKRSRRLWAVAERYADGQANVEQLRAAWRSARWAAQVATRQGDDPTEGVRWFIAGLTDESLLWIMRGIYVPTSAASRLLHREMQCRILRDLIVNPICPVTLSPSWLTTNVVSLAQAIYDQRRFQDMPILADALEDAGCTDDQILTHCRSGLEHVRGCWLIDMLLGKE